MSNPSKIKITIELDITGEAFNAQRKKELLECLNDAVFEIVDSGLSAGDCESTEFNLYDSNDNNIGHCMAESFK